MRPQTTILTLNVITGSFFLEVVLLCYISQTNLKYTLGDFEYPVKCCNELTIVTQSNHKES
jgi:hypothetical protein